MKLNALESIVTSLNAAKVRYLIAGGLAVNAHGYLRYTKDVNFVIQLNPDNIERAMQALTSLGYKPNIPVSTKQFADPVQRQQWITQKGMQVFQLWSDQHKETPIDVFVTEPFPFDDEYNHALIKSLHGTIEVRFVSIPTLIAMKQLANREQDRIDIEHLRMILEDHGRK